MTKFSKILIAGVIILAIGLVGYKVSSKSNPVTTRPDSLRIGSILSLSGDFASYGEEINRGAQIAVDEAQQNGMNVTYINEDDHSTANGSVNAANKLVRTDNVNAAFTATVQEVKPIAPIFDNSNTPLIAVWDSNDFIKNAGPNIFTTGFGTEAAGQTMARHAYNNLGLRKVAVIPQLDDWSTLIGDAFTKEFTKLGGTVMMNEETSANQKDFRTLISKAKNAGAEGIYAPLLPSTAGPFMKQSKELNFNGAFMTGDGFTQDDVTVAGQAADGAYFTNIYANQTEQLALKYKTKFGQEPSAPIFVSFGYDAIQTIITAHQKAITDKISIVEALPKINIEGTGTRINFNNTRASERLEKLYQVQNGQFVEIK